MNATPDWYRETVALHGERVALGTETREQAAAAIAAELALHPEFLARIAGRDVTRWTDRHGQGDLLADALFPMIPAFMTVAPGVKARTADMTAGQLDHARAMITARTRNVVKSATSQQREFTRFYKAVRPLMSGGATVTEAIAQLAAQEPKAA